MQLLSFIIRKKCWHFGLLPRKANSNASFLQKVVDKGARGVLSNTVATGHMWHMKCGNHTRFQRLLTKDVKYTIILHVEMMTF